MRRRLYLAERVAAVRVQPCMQLLLPGGLVNDEAVT